LPFKIMHNIKPSH